MKHKILLTIFIICFIASAILAFLPSEDVCGIGETGCQKVQDSDYSKTFGINNSNLGVVGFIALIFLTISHIKNPKKHKDRFIVAGIIVSSIVAIYFIFLQIFIIKALCQYCMVVDIGSILALVLIYSFRKK